MVSERERIAHVYRRLGVGAHPDLIDVTSSAGEAIDRALDLGGPDKATQTIRVPQTWDEVYEVIDGYEPVVWWIDAMVDDGRLVEERLTWFWHDHFAVSAHKVDHPYAMWEHVRMLRDHATGNFAQLLKAVAKSPAMLAYLDGIDNTAWGLNENYAREVMELHTLGVGNYTQADVVAAARAFTGWKVNETFWDDDGEEVPGRFQRDDVAPWGSYLDADDFDDTVKELLGVSGNLGMDDALDVLLDQPRTATFVAGKLYRDLVGAEPDPPVLERLASEFRSDYEILPLVKAIATDPSFLADGAIRSKVRTPVEKVVTLLQAFPKVRDVSDEDFGWGLVGLLEQLGYLPFAPPNPAGYPKGNRLLGPGQLSEAFALLNAIDAPAQGMTTDDVLDRLGLVDVSDRTRAVLDQTGDPGRKIGLAFGSPEYLLT